MKCSDICKYFNLNSIYSGNGHAGIGGICRKYGIQTDTDSDCLDSLPYREK